MKRILNEESGYHLKPIAEKVHLQDLKDQRENGNHKSDKAPELKMEKEVLWPRGTPQFTTEETEIGLSLVTGAPMPISLPALHQNFPTR